MRILKIIGIMIVSYIIVINVGMYIIRVAYDINKGHITDTYRSEHIRINYPYLEISDVMKFREYNSNEIIKYDIYDEIIVEDKIISYAKSHMNKENIGFIMSLSTSNEKGIENSLGSILFKEMGLVSTGNKSVTIFSHLIKDKEGKKYYFEITDYLGFLGCRINKKNEDVNECKIMLSDVKEMLGIKSYEKFIEDSLGQNVIDFSDEFKVEFPDF